MAVQVSFERYELLVQPFRIIEPIDTDDEFAIAQACNSARALPLRAGGLRHFCEFRRVDPNRKCLGLSPREIADITPFLQLTASQTDEGTVIKRSTVICSQLDGEPDNRYHEIFARQIDTPEKFMRLLALLMGFATGNVVASDGGMGGSTGSWSSSTGQGILELLARALSENPESIDHLATIVEHLRGSASGMAVLPPGWDDVWIPALEARRAMLEAV